MRRWGFKSWLLLLGVWELYVSLGLVASRLVPLDPAVERELGI